MALSVFDLFKVGVGPSSSHTVGPMRAAGTFLRELRDDGLLRRVTRVTADLYGSLGATGRGHGTDSAVLMGFAGELPETVDPRLAHQLLEEVGDTGRLALLGEHEVSLDAASDVVLHLGRSLPLHPNGMTFTAWSGDEQLAQHTYYSVGGGFIMTDPTDDSETIDPDARPLRHPFTTGAELLRICDEEGLSIDGVMEANELSWRSRDETHAGLLHIWDVMKECVRNGMENEGILPGGLHVRRRAPGLWRQLEVDSAPDDPLRGLDWIALYALAVNEENAAGGRVVTAPTNGAAGTIPAVLHYYTSFVPGASDRGVVRFLLTAAAIGMLVKANASISGAEVGCQGEVGSACAMAAAGFAAVLGGTPSQIENAAEIGMEHNLGLTCDPVGGLVQIPCIERNAVAAVKAITAARTAIRGDGHHIVSLDTAIRTMRDTGRDMKDKYKETSLGGLAVNVIEC